MSVDEFNANADSYAHSVDRSISFCNQEHVFFTRRKADLLLDLAERQFGDARSLRFLDIGCGVGSTDAHLERRVGDLHGIDVAGDAIAAARKRNPNVAYESYGGNSLPYDDGEFDVAFAICVLHHVLPEARPPFLAEMARVVRRGGLAVMFEHNPYNPLTRVAVNRCPFDDDAVLLSRREGARALRAAGLTVTEARYVIFLPIDRHIVSSIETWLRWLPFGAQHYVAARRA